MLISSYSPLQDGNIRGREPKVVTTDLLPEAPARRPACSLAHATGQQSGLLDAYLLSGRRTGRSSYSLQEPQFDCGRADMSTRLLPARSSVATCIYNTTTLLVNLSPVGKSNSFPFGGTDDDLDLLGMRSCQVLNILQWGSAYVDRYQGYVRRSRLSRSSAMSHTCNPDKRGMYIVDLTSIRSLSFT